MRGVFFIVAISFIVSERTDYSCSPDVLVDVVGSSTFILEFTNRNEMLVVPHEQCYERVFCSLASFVSECTLFFEVRPDVVADVVVRRSTLILQELTNRNDMLVVFINIVTHAQGFLQCGHHFVDVVVGSSTLILQELTNRNEMRRVLYSVVISFIVSECTDYSWKFVLRSTSRRRRIDKPQRNACGFSLLRMRKVLYSVVIMHL